MLVLQLSLLAGCTSTSGLLLRPGPHKLLWPADDIAQAAYHPQSLPRELDKRVLPQYLVEPGDVLLVEVTDLNSSVRLPGDQTVQPDGTIDLGRYGPLEVAGRTVAQIEADAQRMVAAFESNARRDAERAGDAADGDERGSGPSGNGGRRDREPEAPVELNVRLVEPTSKVYYVTGEVNAPGAYPLVGRETVLDAIIEAGDLTDRANRHKIILSRPSAPGQCRFVLPICYRHIVQLGDTTTNFQIRPGDRIFVSSLTFWQELGQTVFPHAGQQCPTCATPEFACPHATGGVPCLDCQASSAAAAAGIPAASRTTLSARAARTLAARQGETGRSAQRPPATARR
jgi:polysaccharide export outer membrane protein